MRLDGFAGGDLSFSRDGNRRGGRAATTIFFLCHFLLSYLRGGEQRVDGFFDFDVDEVEVKVKSARAFDIRHIIGYHDSIRSNMEDGRWISW